MLDQSALQSSIAVLRRELRGRALTSSDPLYERARRGSGTTAVTDRFPAVVVLPETPEDIVYALGFAQSQALEVSVRSGGHDALGSSTTATGVLIDLARMNGIGIDGEAGVARVGAGARSGELNAAAAPYGLAAVLGMNPNVGVGGVTLGGGIGWLCGTHGATVDNLLAADLVTADGRVVRADDEQNTDLFWALRGGGGNFGIATAFTYQLRPVDRVVAGSIAYRTDPSTFLRFIREFLADSPDELDLAAGFSMSTDLSAYVRVCWSGDLDAGEQALRPLRGYAPALLDDIRPRRYIDFAGSSSQGEPDNMFWRAGELDGLTDEVIAAVSDTLLGQVPSGCMVNVLHYMHGALCRVPSDRTPMIRTPGNILYNIIASWSGVEPPAAATEWVLNAASRLELVSSTRTYVNYLSRPEEHQVAATYGAHYARLRAIKRVWDPGNTFRQNRNIHG